jgi:NAD(P)-dependent dehydrogenase (short-subunit alcohol dehydrogenase family)
MTSPKSLLFPLVAIIALLLASLRSAQQETAPEKPFEGLTVVVTGANRGLGLEFARQLSAGGAQVIGTARDPEGATELAALGVRVARLDVADGKSVAALAKALEDESIDILINNAGVSGRAGQEDGVDYDVIARVLDVNLIGPMRVTHALLPAIERGRGKRIVNISSRLGSIELNESGSYLGYRESKAGLNMFSRSTAQELRPKSIICIAMSPGWVRTDMGGPQATLSPEESIRGMLEVIAGLETKSSGKYFQWDGEELPW